GAADPLTEARRRLIPTSALPGSRAKVLRRQHIRTERVDWAAHTLDGGRTWWAHFAFTRINIRPIILRKKIEDLRVLGAFWVGVRRVSLRKSPDVTAGGLIDLRSC